MSIDSDGPLPDLRIDETREQDERVSRAVAAERERCAKIADDYLVSRDKEQLATEVAARIRRE